MFRGVLDGLLINLHTIGGIPRGRRISTAKEFIILEDISVFQPLYRWRAGDSRDRTVKIVRREVATAIAVAELLMESRHLGQNTAAGMRISADLHRLHTALVAAGPGLNGLCDTYADDANVVAYLAPLAADVTRCAADILAALSPPPTDRPNKSAD